MTAERSRKSKHPPLTRTGPYWVIVQRAWWRNAGDEWMPLVNTMSHQRKFAWAAFWKMFHDPNEPYAQETFRNCRAVKVDLAFSGVVKVA